MEFINLLVAIFALLIYVPAKYKRLKSFFVTIVLVFISVNIYAAVSTPTLNLPASGATEYVGTTINFTWSAVSGATGYELKFDSGQSYTYTATTTTANLSWPIVAGGLGSHTWQVRAKSGTTYSAWTTSRTYTVAFSPITLSSPTNNTIVYVGSTVNFSWTAPSGATAYDVEFDSGQSYAFTTSPTTASLNWLISTSVGSHTWRVRAKAGTSVGAWTATQSYTSAYFTPSPTSPANGATEYVGSSFNFGWTSTPGVTGYDFEYDPGTGYATTVTPTTSSLASIALAAGIGAHTWHVRAKIGTVTGPWSATSNYTIAYQLPNLSAPTNNSTQYVGNSFSFEWSAVTGATDYEVLFDAGTAYASTNTTTSNALPWTFSAGGVGTHTWKVRAKYVSAYGPYSGIYTYIVAFPVISLVSPANGATFNVGDQINLNWSLSSDANSYEIQFDTGTAYQSTSSSTTPSLKTTAATGGIGKHTWQVRAKYGTSFGLWSSAQTYTILPQSLTLTSPNGGENWIIGTNQNINWTATGITGNVKVEINGQYPGNLWETLFSSIPASGGTISWPVTGAAGNAKRVRVTSVDFPAISTTSNTNFSLTTAVSTPGVTILAHGYYLKGSLSNPISYWGEDFIVKLLKAHGGGKVMVYQSSNGSFLEATDHSKFYDPGLNNPNGETILLMNWLDESNNDEAGEAEAAADALFASLVSPTGSGEPDTRYINLANPTASKPLHLIGHSRGTVVISELAQRMGKYGIKVNYATFLDPHDYDEPGVPFDENFHDPAVQIWNNINYADNYWQQASLNVVPSGRTLDQFKSSYAPNQYQLTALHLFYDNVNPINNSHGEVVTWYSGTIEPNSQETDWYTDGSGTGWGWTKWFSLGGYNYTGNAAGVINAADPIAAGGGTNSPGAKITPYPQSNDGDQDYAPTNFFMGDFSLKDLGGTTASPAPSIAGWYYHGGGGYGYQDGNGYLILKYQKWSKTHNRFVVPLKATKLKFQYRVVSASAADKLLISVGTADIKQVDLDNTSGWKQEEIDLSSYQGKVRTLSFAINPAPVTPLGPEVWITNISIDEQVTGGSNLVPTITAFTPVTGASGATVTITGTNFTGATAVNFGTVPAASVTVVSSTSIKATVAAGASGTVTIVTPGGTASLAGFTFNSATSCTMPSAPAPLFGADVCISPFSLSGISASLNFTGNSASSYSAAVSKYPYETPNLIYTSSCQTSTAPFSVNGLVPGMVYRWNMFAYGATDCSSCKSPVSIAKYFSITPVITAPTTQLTVGGSIALSTTAQSPGSGATVNYRWLKDGQAFQQGNNLTNINVSAPGTYTLVNDYSGNPDCGGITSTSASNAIVITAASGTGCTASTAATSISQIVVGNTGSGPTIQLTVTGGSLGTNGVWHWYSGSCGGTPVGTGTSITFNPTATDDYFVRAEGDCGTTACAQTTVWFTAGCTYATDPTSISASANNINPGMPVALTVNGGSLGMNGSWYLTTGSCGGTPAGSGRGLVFNVNPLVTTTYYLQAVSSCNTTNCVQVTVNVLDKPVITALSPVSAPAGTQVTITGSNLSGATAVSFGGTAATSFIVNSATSITATIGNGSSGDVSISTPGGTATLNGFNYVFSLPVNNFTVAMTSASCRGSNNGSIGITAVQALNYTATVTGPSTNASYPFTNNKTITNLAPGTYSICISITGQTYQQCFTAVITEPKDLALYAAHIDPVNKTADLLLTGGDTYYISLNGSPAISTSQSNIRLNLQAGNNRIVLTSDKPCQTPKDTLINLSVNPVPYPIPFENSLNVNLGLEPVKITTIAIYSVANGAKVYSGTYINRAGVLILDLSRLNSGVYEFWLSRDGQTTNAKINKP